MYKSLQLHQITFQDFNQSCVMKLSSENEWCQLGDQINRNATEGIYSKNFPGKTERPAFSVCMALGSLMIQKKMGVNDRVLVKTISENPYYWQAMRCPFLLPIFLESHSVLFLLSCCWKQRNPRKNTIFLSF